MMTTPEERVLHCAQVWRETEKSAMGAADGEKNRANRAHHMAKRELRDAVDMLNGGKP